MTVAKQPEVQYINAYVSGTTAYKLEKPQPQKPRVRLPKPKKQQALVLCVDPIAVISIAVALVMILFLTVNVVRLGIARHDAQVLENHVALLQQDQQRLQHTYSESFDLEEVRRIATAMGMVPVDQLPVREIQVVVPQQPPERSGWESFWMFVTEMLGTSE